MSQSQYTFMAPENDKEGKGKNFVLVAKPCPFCGGFARVWRTGAAFSVGCENDACNFGPWGTFDSEKESIEKWNHRA